MENSFTIEYFLLPREILAAFQTNCNVQFGAEGWQHKEQEDGIVQVLLKFTVCYSH